MQAPSRRIWLWPALEFTRARDIEIIVVGDPELIAPFVSELRTVLERWPGFERVRPLVMGSQQIGFLATRSNLATHDDPIAEAMLMLARFPIDWRATLGTCTGAVGTW